MVWYILLHQGKPWISIHCCWIYYRSIYQLSSSYHISCNITLYMIKACNYKSLHIFTFILRDYNGWSVLFKYLYIRKLYLQNVLLIIAMKVLKTNPGGKGFWYFRPLRIITFHDCSKSKRKQENSCYKTHPWLECVCLDYSCLFLYRNPNFHFQYQRRSFSGVHSNWQQFVTLHQLSLSFGK